MRIADYDDGNDHLLLLVVDIRHHSQMNQVAGAKVTQTKRLIHSQSNARDYGRQHEKKIVVTIIPTFLFDFYR